MKKLLFIVHHKNNSGVFSYVTHLKTYVGDYIFLNGAGDRAIKELDNKTTLESVNIPH